jgi:hypothetical protein
MTVTAALSFVRRARSDSAIREALEQAAAAPSLQAVCAIGRDHGLDFSEAEFDLALKIEWSARWAHFGNGARDAMNTSEKGKSR